MEENKEIVLHELTNDNKALLIIGFSELIVQYAEDLMQDEYFSKLFTQKLKFHTNGMIKHYDKVLNHIVSGGSKAVLGDQLVLMATSIENSIRACIEWESSVKSK